MPEFTVHIRREWTERFALSVNADTIEDARNMALHEADEHSVDWDDMHEDEKHVFAIDNAEDSNKFRIVDAVQS